MAMWERVEDGEYNEYRATVNGHQVTIYSDRYETQYSCSIDEEESFNLEATNKSDAMREAEQEAKSWLQKT